MATKSSKIAVTLQPGLKQKLREYGKDNQIKNFSGVILAILDEYLGGSAPATSSSSSSDVLDLIQSLTDRVNALENGAATNSDAIAETTDVAKPKGGNGRRGARSTSRSKPKTSATVQKSSDRSSGTATRAPKSTVVKKAKPTKATKGAASKTKSTRSVKSSSKSAPAKKSKPTLKPKTRRAPAGRKSAKATKAEEWMSTREAFNIYGGSLSWSRFSKLTPEELKERFNLDSDLSRKVRGSRFNQWLTPGN
ncbi:MAG: hypothetical protein AAGB01_01985 [Cyanobacteria bacterium P01_F01_bin.42]